MAQGQTIEVDLLSLSDKSLDNLLKSGVFFPPVSGMIETVKAMSSTEAIALSEAGQGGQYRIPVPVNVYELLVG